MTDESTILRAVGTKRPGASGGGDHGARETREPSGDHGARETREPSPELEREFEAIYLREFPVALRFARRYVDDATAEDTVQTVFMRYWEGYTQTPALVFRPDRGRTEAAILTAVRNELRLKSRRTRTFLRKADQLRAELVATIRNAAAPDRPSAEMEISEAVARALDRLPLRQREVFALVKFDEKSYAETAEILGISPSTVHHHLVQANARLRSELAEYRVADADWSHLKYNPDIRIGKKDAQP